MPTEMSSDLCLGSRSWRLVTKRSFRITRSGETVLGFGIKKVLAAQEVDLGKLSGDG